MAARRVVFLAPIAQSDHLGLEKGKNAKMAENNFLGTFIKNHSGFVESNVQGAIAWLCLVFRAFSQINSSTSWPTVGGAQWAKRSTN